MAFPKKPSAVKLAEGNRGKRKPNLREPRPEICAPDCPRHIVGEARAEWRRLSAELLRLGLLSRVDRAAFAAYCQCWATWVACETKLKAEGLVVEGSHGGQVANPLYTISDKCQTQMRRFLVEFGLTPASRSRIISGGNIYPNPEDDIDAFAKLKIVNDA